MTRSVRRLGVGLACAGMLVAAGCGGDPEPEVSPTETSATPSESPSPSESPTDLEMPDEAKEDSENGAREFLRAYVRAIHRAVVTGDFSVLDKHSAADCSSCENAKKNIQEHYTEGGTIEGAEYRITHFSALQETEDGSRRMRVRYVRPNEVMKDAEGAVVNTAPKTDVLLTFTLDWDQENWIVRDWAAGET